jgi:two-component system sensor kinase FixL
MSKPRSQTNELHNLRKRAEIELMRRKRKISPNELEHELNVYEIELQMQNLELIETQEKLRASLKEYEELFQLSPVGYFILNENGVIENVNERGVVQLGFDKTHLVEKPFSTFLHTEVDQDNFYRHRNLAIALGTLQRMECEIKKKDCSVFSALIKSKVIKDEKLEFKHLLSIMTDISQIKEREHQIEIQLIKSEGLNTMKSRFIGMASHEFRTPLTSISSSTTLIEQYAELGEPDKIKRHLTRIRTAIKNLVTILDDFLSIEKLESGKVEIRRTTFKLPEFCEEIIEDVYANKKRGQVINYTHKGSGKINTDKNIIQHILLNLLSNACKYSGDEKEINLSTSIDDHTVTLIVEDYGIGIPEAEQDSVFIRFFRAHNTATVQGTGLGLNIVKRYVELLNGTIDFVSKHNEGTTFIVKFPQKP